MTQCFWVIHDLIVISERSKSLKIGSVTVGKGFAVLLNRAGERVKEAGKHDSGT